MKTLLTRTFLMQTSCNQHLWKLHRYNYDGYFIPIKFALKGGLW